ncbi:MAG: hypothetical protein COA32_02945 [Fluviicola sp.]|nr:MAG: hypothetical protein COA32_02945 [Fluviicola sp.]
MRLCLKSFFLFFLLSCQSSEENRELDFNTTHSDSIIDTSGEEVAVQISVGAEKINEILELIEGKSVAIVANQTSRVGDTHLVDTLIALNVDVKAVFSPEHGFRGDADAGEKVNSKEDQKTGLPLFSLYGSNRKPTKNQLEGIDIVIFDVQDVGARFYTYISTLHYVMEACAESNKKVIILDRPNPNGQSIDGPVRKSGYESFVGMHPIPVIHGMTIGEYGKMINGEKWLKNELVCELEIVTCENYTHDSTYSLPIAPSPNLRSDQSIALYPSLCLFEGTIMSVGRGTETPFEVFGHPDLDKYPDKYNFEFTPKPSYGAKHPKLEDKKCFGKDLSEINIENGKLNLEWLIESYNDVDRNDFFITKNGWFDLLAGTNELRKQIEKGLSESEIRASWEDDLKAFRLIRKKYLIYD